MEDCLNLFGNATRFSELVFVDVICMDTMVVECVLQWITLCVSPVSDKLEVIDESLTHQTAKIARRTGECKVPLQQLQYLGSVSKRFKSHLPSVKKMHTVPLNYGSQGILQEPLSRLVARCQKGWRSFAQTARFVKGRQTDSSR
jgi:hypothetical protein